MHGVGGSLLTRSRQRISLDLNLSCTTTLAALSKSGTNSANVLSLASQVPKAKEAGGGVVVACGLTAFPVSSPGTSCEALR